MEGDIAETRTSIAGMKLSVCVGVMQVMLVDLVQPRSARSAVAAVIAGEHKNQL